MPVLCDSRVYPSGLAEAATCAPTWPAAPALASTTTGCLRIASMAVASGRVTMSLRPPGGNALMMVIACEGKVSCANAPPAASAVAAVPMTKRRRSMLFLLEPDSPDDSLSARVFAHVRLSARRAHMRAQGQTDTGAQARISLALVVLAQALVSSPMLVEARLEAEDDKRLDPGLLDELHHVAEHSGRHRSALLHRVHVDENRHSIAHHKSGEHRLPAGGVDPGAFAAGDRALRAVAAGALDPPLPDVAADQEGPGRGGDRSVDGLAAALHEEAKIPQGRHSLPQRRSRRRNVPGRRRQVPGDRGRQRASAGPDFRGARIVGAGLSADAVGRMRRKRSRADAAL